VGTLMLAQHFHHASVDREKLVVFFGPGVTRQTGQDKLFLFRHYHHPWRRCADGSFPHRSAGLVHCRQNYCRVLRSPTLRAVKESVGAGRIVLYLAGGIFRDYRQHGAQCPPGAQRDLYSLFGHDRSAAFRIGTKNQLSPVSQQRQASKIQGSGSLNPKKEEPGGKSTLCGGLNRLSVTE